MDPITLGILTGVMANVLTPFLAQLSEQVLQKTEVTKKLPHVLSFLGQTDRIQEAIGTAVNDLVAQREIVGFELAEHQKQFIQKPEVREIISIIYSSCIVVSAANINDSPTETKIDSIREAFHKLAQLLLASTEHRITDRNGRVPPNGVGAVDK